MAIDYKEIMLNNIADVLDKIGTDDSEYTDKQKTIDSLEVLEYLLAYGIANACIDRETIRDACDDVAASIKKLALIFEQNRAT